MHDQPSAPAPTVAEQLANLINEARSAKMRDDAEQKLGTAFALCRDMQLDPVPLGLTLQFVADLLKDVSRRFVERNLMLLGYERDRSTPQDRFQRIKQELEVSGLSYADCGISDEELERYLGYVHLETLHSV